MEATIIRLSSFDQTDEVKSQEKLPWGQVQQNAFENIKISKKLISNEVIFAYPDFTKGFDIHVDANDT